ncbi:MAG TPA: hypothetical protein VMZ02_02650 [Candidatus Limnocylindrales bacterium]|nr:hypothetical protein [Candidatus Limnocylindrales bacterium]
MRIQLEQAAANRASEITVGDSVDESIVRGIKKAGFIDRLY